MIQQERQQIILKLLEEKDFMSIRDLAKKTYSSEASVRRDIQVLEKSGVLTHVHGGVTLARFQNTIVPIRYRDQDNAPDKELIARKAAQLVQNGSTVFMDASSTTRRILKYLSNAKNVKIITNNLRLFTEVAPPSLTLYCTGGTFNAENDFFTGSAAEAYIRSVYADIVFFSGQGVTENGDITYSTDAEASLRRAMIANADRSVFLCDTSKIGIRKMFRLCNVSEVDDVICNDDNAFNMIPKEKRS